MSDAKKNTGKRKRRAYESPRIIEDETFERMALAGNCQKDSTGTCRFGPLFTS